MKRKTQIVGSNKLNSTHQMSDADLCSGDELMPLELQMSLLAAVGRGTGRGFTEEEGEKVLEWAQQSLINMSFVNLASEGLVNISFNKQGELIFAAVPIEEVEGKPGFGLPSKGNQQN